VPIAKIARALISVSDKTGVVELGRRLSAAGLEILSTGGTAKALAAAGVPVREVGDFTGAPEILDGRVKTLHPRIHGGILGRPTPAHRAEMQAAGIVPIDLVVVNLYPFRETVARGAPFDEVIENIDIGGPAMIRSAAKNHERTAVLVDPADYAAVLAEIDADGEISSATRFRLARKAFAHTAAYDGAIASHLGRFTAADAAPADFPESLYFGGKLARAMRYGENPHQKAAFYETEGSAGPSLARAQVLQGKELSYNNLLDLDAALRICAEFTAPAATIVKHNNPCGAATSDVGIADAYRRARETDPVSAFGGIVAVNRPVDGELAREIKETFLECVIAPGLRPRGAVGAVGEQEPAVARV
jgi:phosphoribosylaminoimidazolecarboxamide formyltransferase/IMP cyclohydrolase